MRKFNLGKNLTAMLMAWALLVMPLAAIGQTRVTMPRNKYKVQDDVKLGQQAAAEVERQMPILNDSEATRYVQQVGQRLVNGIPSEFREPAFNYRFQIVNARDINAFALPGRTDVCQPRNDRSGEKRRRNGWRDGARNRAYRFASRNFAGDQTKQSA
jgi:hypothetical protein